MGARPYLSRHVSDRWLAGAIAVVAFIAQYYRHATFRSSTYDMAVFEQVVWKMAHGHGATSSLTAWNTFGDHLSPVLLVFVPLYRLAATPLWFFAAQAIAVGIGVLCIRPLAVAAGLPERGRAVTLLLAAYAISPAIWNGVLGDFHPTTVAVPVLLIGCTVALKHRHRDMWLVLGALILLRDDLALAGVALAAIGWTTDTRRGRQVRGAIVATGLAWTVIGAQVGAALGASRHFEARYGYLGTSLTDAATHPFHAIAGVLSHLFATNNVVPVLALLVPLALLPLGRPAWALLAGFVALPTLLATDPNLHSSAYHYGAPVAPFLFLAAAGTLARFDLSAYRRVVFYGAPLATASFLFAGPLSTGALTAQAPNPGDVRAALRTVKATDVVVATGYVAPHVADRATLLPFPYPFLEASHVLPLDPEVTSTSAKKQATVDVVIVAPSELEGPELIDHFLNDPTVIDEFTQENFGDVMVFRRKTGG